MQVPPDVLPGRYANEIIVAQLKSKNPSGEEKTRSVVLMFVANYPEGKVCTAKVVMDREDFSSILKHLVEGSRKGGPYNDFVE